MKKQLTENKRFFLSCMVVLLVTSMTFAHDTLSTVPQREYRLLLGDPQELECIAGAGVLLNKALSDAFYRGFGPRLPRKIAPVAQTVWSVGMTFMCSLWPHEFGHWARARQTGGDFIFEKIGFPFPVAKMKFPLSYDPVENGTLSSVGGFEINYLMRQQTHRSFYKNGHAFSDELIHSFIQEVYFPFYAFVVAFPKTSDPYTWTHTRGDPVESALSVFKAYTKRPALRPDSTVDPDLTRYYWEAIGANLVWTLLDPMLYQSARAFGVDMRRNSGLMRPWMAYKNGPVCYTYGTSFNPSPLGYELFLTNYLLLYDKLYTVYFKAGRPYKNLGSGFSTPELARLGNLTVGASCDFWIQDVYGNGSSVTLLGEYHINKGLDLLLHCGWKDRGYVVGKRVDESASLLGGLSYSF